MTHAAPTTGTRVWMTLAVLCALSLLVLWWVASANRERIARNERAWFAAQISTLVPATLHDNDLLSDRTQVIAPASLGERAPLTVYRARRAGTPTAVVITAVAPDGYNGPIRLLIGIDYAGVVLGVHILEHHETPGMGDVFARELSAQPGLRWLDAFVGRSLGNPDTRGWNVRKDGGEFAQFASATITPRAIIHAVQKALDYYQRNRDALFKAPADTRGITEATP